MLETFSMYNAHTPLSLLTYGNCEEHYQAIACCAGSLFWYAIQQALTLGSCSSPTGWLTATIGSEDNLSNVSS